MYLNFIWFLVWKYHKKNPRWVRNTKGMKTGSYLYGNFPLSEVYFNVMSICKWWPEISTEILSYIKGHAPNYHRLYLG